MGRADYWEPGKPVIDEFKYDPLPLIAVSVDMLDTGYDQKDIENLIMLRPTKSPIKYAQMRGRGSRIMLVPVAGSPNGFIYGTHQTGKAIC